MIEEAGEAANPVHHRNSDRDRRDAGRARAEPDRDPRRARALRPYPGSDHPELPRQAGVSRWRTRRSPTRSRWRARSRPRGWCWAPKMNVQAPPNLSPNEIELFLRAGINDWGGISPLSKDYVNPEAPWPHLEQLAATLCAGRLSICVERLAIYPEYINDEWVDPAIRPAHRSARRSSRAEVHREPRTKCATMSTRSKRRRSTR